MRRRSGKASTVVEVHLSLNGGPALHAHSHGLHDKPTPHKCCCYRVKLNWGAHYRSTTYRSCALQLSLVFSQLTRMHSL